MAIQCPQHFDREYLRQQVQVTYDRVAREPGAEYHFHRGPEYAHTFLGYDLDELKSIPRESTSRFAGVGNPILIGDANPEIGAIQKGHTVLDHACGAGMDILIAARRVGASGKAIGVDMTRAMRQQARESARIAGLTDTVDIRDGFFEDLPVEDNSVDIVISNGVVNLAPDKQLVFDEIFRVLKPGGKLFLSDVVVQCEMTLDARSNPDLWAACIGGAVVEKELYPLAQAAGLVDARIVQRFNCFYNTSAERKVAKDLFIHSVNFFARKPE